MFASVDEPIAGRQAQGVRPPRAGGDPADVDDRVPPAPRRGRRVHHRAGTRSSPRRSTGRPTPSRSAASATRRRTTPPPSARSTRPATAPTPTCRCRSCSCVRTTASGSASAPRPAGSRPPTAGAPDCGTPRVDGTDPAGVYDTAAELAAWVRAARRPAFLHLRTVRFLGHAGSDVEAAYRTPEEIRRRLPVATRCSGTARQLVEGGFGVARGHPRPKRRGARPRPDRRAGDGGRPAARLGGRGDGAPVARAGRTPSPTPRRGLPAPTRGGSGSGAPCRRRRGR